MRARLELHLAGSAVDRPTSRRERGARCGFTSWSHRWPDRRRGAAGGRIDAVEPPGPDPPSPGPDTPSPGQIRRRGRRWRRIETTPRRCSLVEDGPLRQPPPTRAASTRRPPSARATPRRRPPPARAAPPRRPPSARAVPRHRPLPARAAPPHRPPPARAAPPRPRRAPPPPGEIEDGECRGGGRGRGARLSGCSAWEGNAAASEKSEREGEGVRGVKGNPKCWLIYEDNYRASAGPFGPCLFPWRAF